MEMKGVEKRRMWVALGKTRKDREGERKIEFLREASQLS